MHGSERRILNYWLAEELGHDRLGRVFRAEEARANRTVVLRLLRVAGVAPADRVKAARDALRRRIRAAAAIVHSNLAAVLDFASHEDLEVLAVEDVQGDSLRELAARGELLPLDEVLWHASEIAAGLEAAHAKHVTHGRISAANIRLGRDGRARLLDLGIPRPTEVAFHMAGVADGDVLNTERRRDVHALARTIQFMVAGSEEPAALKEARTLPGLGGDIVRAVHAVVQSPAADVAALRAALVDVARHTRADPHVAERPVLRPAAPPHRRPAQAVRPLPAPEPAPPEPEPVAAAAPGLLVPPADGWSRPAHANEPGPPMASPVLIPDARPHRRSAGARLAGALRERRREWSARFDGLRSLSAAQFAGSVAAGAFMVFIGLWLVRPGGDEVTPDVIVPAAELAAAETPLDAPDPADGPVAEPVLQVPPAVPGAEPSPAPQTGALRISVTPRGALVSLDGGPWRPAPVSFIELPAGTHRIRIRRDGFADQDVTVTVRPGETTRRSFELDAGSP